MKEQAMMIRTLLITFMLVTPLMTLCMKTIYREKMQKKVELLRSRRLRTHFSLDLSWYTEYLKLTRSGSEKPEYLQTWHDKLAVGEKGRLFKLYLQQKECKQTRWHDNSWIELIFGEKDDNTLPTEPGKNNRIRRRL